MNITPQASKMAYKLFFYSLFFFGFTLNTQSYASTDGDKILAPVLALLLSEDDPYADYNTELDAIRLMERATFGPNEAGVKKILDIGIEAWVDQQIATPATYHGEMVDDNDQSRRSFTRMIPWWDATIFGQDQLRQRMAYALSQILVISESEILLHQKQRGMIHYYDILVEQGLGNYRELLTEVSTSPAMGDFLSFRNNTGPNEDQNYAREVMQLFTIGLHQLNIDGTLKLDSKNNPIPTYQQEDVEAMAKIFSGWTFENGNAARFSNVNGPYLAAMDPVESRHTKDRKVLFTSQPELVTVFPAGQSARADMKMALDALFEHPNLAPFVSKQLIQRLVTSNPSPAYVARVATVFRKTGGDLAAVAKAIVLDKAALDGHIGDSARTFGKLKEPIQRVTHFWRAGKAQKGTTNIFVTYNTDRFISQEPLSAKSVFNFYQNDYRPPQFAQFSGFENGESQTDFVGPEFAISSGTQTAGFFNFTFGLFHTYIGGPGSKNFTLYQNPDSLVSRLELDDNYDEFIRYVDLYYAGGTMSQSMKNGLRSFAQNIRSSSGTTTDMVRHLNAMIYTSPDFSVQL